MTEKERTTRAIKARGLLDDAAYSIELTDAQLDHLPQTHGARLGCNALRTAIAAIRLGLEAEFLTPTKEPGQ